ncbi:MAG: glycerol-3-phosphate 1-O-acyltransferase PlsY [Alphaproteobacteria bacterium]
MMDEFTLFISIFSLIAYLIGSIPFGLILTKIFIKEDIRKIGSGNIGATNVLRTGNKILGLSTLLLDSSKGVLAIGCAVLIFSINNFYIPNAAPSLPQIPPIKLQTLSLLIGLFAILGHCFPIWLKFKGGKGVATALGALLAAVPYAGLAACAAWLITAKVTKISSLSALIALAIAPIVTLIIYGASPAVICALITLLVWIRHKDNIKRIIKGEEPKIGAKKKEEKSVESISNE